MPSEADRAASSVTGWLRAGISPGEASALNYGWRSGSRRGGARESQAFNRAEIKAANGVLDSLEIGPAAGVVGQRVFQPAFDVAKLAVLGHEGQFAAHMGRRHG